MKVLKYVETKLGNKIELISSTNRSTNQPFNQSTVQTFNYYTALIIGVFHGDEPQGKYLIDEYLKTNIPHSPMGKGGKLFIPCLNPDGMLKNTRVNASGVDLNRNFPTKNWGEDTSAAGDNPLDYFCGKSAASEIETRFLIDVIEEYKPSVILTLHAPYKVVNYDGPAREIADKISKIIGYQIEESIGYPTPGSFGTWAGVERNIPVITLELDEKISVDELIEPIFEIFDTL